MQSSFLIKEDGAAVSLSDVAEVRENLYELRTAPPKIRTDLKALIELTPDATQAIKIMARQLLR